MRNKKQTLKAISEGNDSDKISFLIAEFHELGDFLRHTDARIEMSLNFYLTTIAFLVPASILLYQSVKDIKLLLIGAIAASAVVLFIGTFLVRRVYAAQQIKEEYRHGLNLIRRYFVDNHPDIADYLYLPTTRPLKESERRTWEFYIPIPDKLILVIYGVNSFLVGLMLGLILLLVTPMPMAVVITIVLVIWITHFSVSLGSVIRRARIKKTDNK